MLSRRNVLVITSTAAIGGLQYGCATTLTPPTQRRTVSLDTGSKGGGFLLYGEALAKVLSASHLQLQVNETQGTAANINRLDARQIDAALLVMGPTYDAWTGQAQWAGKPVRGMRALFPMYETPFHVAVAASSPINSVSQLAGKRVGVGPARGTAEGFLRGLLEANGLAVVFVNGNPSDHAKQLASGQIDAFWFGAGLPVPGFVEAAQIAPIKVFGLTEQERAAFIKRFPYFAPYSVPAGTYSGQASALQTVAVWNFAAVHQDAPDELAYWLTRLPLEKSTELTNFYKAASGTSVSNLGTNTFLPFHAGAMRYFKERGVAVKQPVA